MSANVWSNREDVLKDLKEVTGGHPGVSNLDGYVAVGERPPPDRRESIDEDEFKYHFGMLGSGVGGNTSPDLDGISQMLQLVNENTSGDNEPKTIFRNTMTDKISISKLNPNVTEFVPSSCGKSQPKKEHKPPEKGKFKSPTKHDHSNQGLSKINNEIKVSKENIGDVKKEKDQEKSINPSHLLSVANNDSTINEMNGKQKNTKMGSSASNSVSGATVNSKDISLDKKVDVSKLKTEEIEEMKIKIKSKIIDSSGDSIQNKKEKNVAMAALLRLYAAAPAVPAQKPVKLITPDYFEAPPADAKSEAKKEHDATETETSEELEETPAESTSRKPVVYTDPFVEESIAKVNDWFENAGSPEPTPKPLPVLPPAAPPVPLDPVQFKDLLSLKKKNASSLSVNSPISESSSEKKKAFTAFVPSAYASDLLEKYENNAKTQAAPKEDWRVTLERQLKEKDVEIRKKIRDKQDSTSPNSGGGN